MKPFKSKSESEHVVQNADGTVTINLDEFQKRSNRKIFVPLIGLIFAVVVAVFASNAGRVASTQGLTALKADFANNARTACITNRKSLQAEAAGEMQAYTLRAVAAAQASTPQIIETFRSAPLGTFAEEIAKGSAASIRWAGYTVALDPKIVDRPVNQGGCGMPVTSDKAITTVPATTSTVPTTVPIAVR